MVSIISVFKVVIPIALVIIFIVIPLVIIYYRRVGLRLYFIFVYFPSFCHSAAVNNICYLLPEN